MSAPVVSPTQPDQLVRSRVLSYGYSLVLMGWLDPTQPTDLNLAAHVRDQVALLLDPRPAHDHQWLEDVDDAFGQLVTVLHRLADFDNNPDDFLAALPRPQTTEMRDVVRGALLADREYHLGRLTGLAR